MNRHFKFASAAAVLVALAQLAAAQQTRDYREGGTWVREITGQLAAAPNLRIKVDSGAVRVQGGSQSNITYVIHRVAYTSSEEQARREFESYRITTMVKGDTAWITAESARRPRKCAGDFIVTVPRNLELAKIETEGGDVKTIGIAGRAEIQSGGGSIRVDDLGGAISAETGGGSMTWAMWAATSTCAPAAAASRLRRRRERSTPKAAAGAWWWFQACRERCSRPAAETSM